MNMRSDWEGAEDGAEDFHFFLPSSNITFLFFNLFLELESPRLSELGFGGERESIIFDQSLS